MLGVRRRHGGLIISFAFYLFAMFYMHYDSALFWQAPLEYFDTHDFPYMFIASFELSLLGFFLPICAALSARIDQPNVCRKLKDSGKAWAKSTVTGLLPLLLAFLFFVIISLCVMPYTGTTRWQAIGIGGAYGWRISNDWFWVYVVECLGRLSLSVIIWVTVTQALSIVIRNKVLVVLSVAAIAQLLSWGLMRVGHTDWDLRSLQIPDIFNTIPLSILLGRQLLYLFFAVSIWITIILIHGAKARGPGVKDTSRAVSQEANDSYTYHSKKGAQIKNSSNVQAKGLCLAFIASIIIPSIYVAVLASSIASLPSVGDHLIFVFGGFPWGAPDIDVNNVVLWIMLFIPTFCGLAFFDKEYTAVSKELEPRLVQKQILAQQGYLLSYTILCVVVMWISIIGHALLSGASFSSLSAPLTDRYNISQIAVIIYLFFVFSAQILFWSQIYLLILQITKSPGFAAIVYIFAPFMMILLGSNEDKLPNTKLITNWGMIFRSDLFSAHFIEETISDGTTKLFQLCTFSPRFALSRQVICFLGIVALNVLIVWQPWSRFCPSKQAAKGIDNTL